METASSLHVDKYLLSLALLLNFYIFDAVDRDARVGLGGCDVELSHTVGFDDNKALPITYKNEFGLIKFSFVASV